MKKFLPVLATFFAMLLLSTAVLGQPTDFVPGNLVVTHIGDGNALTTASTQLELAEYNPAGTLIQSVSIDPSTAGARLTVAGSSTSESHLNRSADGRYLILCGFDAAPAVASITTSVAQTVNRVVARVDYHAAVDYSTKITDTGLAGDIRSGISADGSAFWASTSASGIRYVTFGNTGTSVQISSAPTNTRVVNIYNGQLYTTSASGAFLSICTVGSGLPTTSSQTTTVLNGMPTTGSHAPYAYAISSDGNTAYLADDAALASGGGVQKWTNSGGTWTLAYTLTTGLTIGVRGLTVDWSGPNPIIYCTEASISNTNLFKVTDTGSGSSFASIATAGANYAFRGVAFAPLQNALPVELSSFTAAARNGRVDLNWTTKTEVSNHGFEVERRTVNSEQLAVNNWSKVAFVDGHGTTNTPQNYSYSDNSASLGKYSYRLKQIDRNGKFEYSKEVEAVVGMTPNTMSLGQNYPNPFNPETNIEFAVPASGFTTLKVYNMLGEEVSTLVSGNVEAGVLNKVSFKGLNLASGLYFYTLRSGNFVDTKKMTLMK